LPVQNTRGQLFRLYFQSVKVFKRLLNSRLAPENVIDLNAY
jgi:hypothetical protein